ncbi:hypothetical protein [Tumidithrix elongata]
MEEKDERHWLGSRFSSQTRCSREKGSRNTATKSSCQSVKIVFSGRLQLGYLQRILRILMSQILTLELSERVFAAIQQQAETIGMSPEYLAATLLERQLANTFKLLLNEVEKDEARTRFERHFGALNDQSMSFDNENIDADLAREYAGIHEDK